MSRPKKYDGLASRRLIVDTYRKLAYSDNFAELGRITKMGCSVLVRWLSELGKSGDGQVRGSQRGPNARNLASSSSC